jgi:outer membrane protein assembly factor BamB
MKKASILLSLLAVLSVSCKKDEAPVKEPKLELVWKKYLAPDFIQITRPFIFRDQVVFADANIPNANNNLYFYDKVDGNLDTIVEMSARINDVTMIQSRPFEDKFLIADLSGVSCYSLAGKKFLWKSQAENGERSVYVSKNHAYQGTFNNSLNSYTIDKIDVLTGFRESIYAKPTEPNVRGHFHSMAFAHLPNGDELLISKFMGENNTKSPPYDHWMDVLCINLTHDSLMWVAPRLEYAEYSLISPVVKDGVVYCPGDSLFFALNLMDGSVKWRFENFNIDRRDQFMNGGFSLTTDRVLIKLRTGIYILNRFTGEQIRFRSNHGGTLPRDFTPFENKLIYTGTEGLYVIDNYTGDILLFTDDFQFVKNLGLAVGVDVETGYLYYTSDKHLLCVKLPEEI